MEKKKRRKQNESYFLDRSQTAFHQNSSGSSRHKETEMSQLSRNQARKSRFTDAFLDARDRLDEQREADEPSSNVSDSNFRQMKVVLAAETTNIPLGIEVESSFKTLA